MTERAFIIFSVIPQKQLCVQAVGRYFPQSCSHIPYSIGCNAQQKNQLMVLFTPERNEMTLLNSGF